MQFLGVTKVGRDMFTSVPKGDAIFVKVSFDFSLILLVMIL